MYMIDTAYQFRAAELQFCIHYTSQDYTYIGL